MHVQGRRNSSVVRVSSSMQAVEKRIAIRDSITITRCFALYSHSANLFHLSMYRLYKWICPSV
jgi:hypothetical protein